MSAIVAPDGSPLSAAVLSCASLERTAAFYCDVIGFDAAPEQVWAGELFERWWNLPRGSSARMCLLTASDCPIGRILLLAFIAPRREPIRPAANSLVFGLANLNFYTADVCAATARLRRAGLQFWSEPTAHRLSAAVGSPIEVVFDGPDGVAINLVELATADANTRIGQMRAYVERHGWTRAGFTPVVTTAHVARDLARARRFYEQVCRMGVLFEDLMSAERVNAFLRLPPDARTRIVFLQGAHMFGKIALSEPLNYAAQCIDLTTRARAPNIGYLAQHFVVRDVDAACAAAQALGAEMIVPPVAMAVPGLAPMRHFLARNPGSGALMWIAG